MMTVEITFGQLVAVMAFFLVALGVVGKILLGQMQTNMRQFIGSIFNTFSDRLTGIENANKEESEQWKRVERELNELQKDLPLHYVRREDYIRGQTILETKIDSLAQKLENVQLRQLLRGDKHDS